jgi:hypothetical protein
MKELLFNPNENELLIYVCEASFVLGWIILWLNENHKPQMNEVLKPEWFYSIIGVMVALSVVRMSLDNIKTYTEKGLLNVGSIPQVFNFLIREIKVEQAETDENPIIFPLKNQDNDFSKCKHLFVFDRTGSQARNEDLETIEKSLRQKIIDELLTYCNKLYNDEKKLKILRNLKYGELMLLYTIIITYQNAGRDTLAVNVVNYLGHNHNHPDGSFSYINNSIRVTDKCTIIDSCLSHFTNDSTVQNQKSYYSLLLEKVYNNCILEENDNQNKIILTMVGDFLNEEQIENSLREDRKGVYLRKILKTIKDENKGQIRAIVLKSSQQNNSLAEPTLSHFSSVFEDSLRIIKIDNLGGNTNTIINGLSNSLKAKNIIIRYEKKEDQNPTYKLNIPESNGKTYLITNLCESNIVINTSKSNTIVSKATEEIRLESDVFSVVLPITGDRKLTISQNGTSIPLNLEFIEFTPKYLGLVILFIIATLFTSFFFGFLKHCYVPLYETYKYHHRPKIFGIKIGIKTSDILAVWASTIGLIFVMSILQLLLLCFNNTLTFISCCIFIWLGLLLSNRFSLITIKK